MLRPLPARTATNPLGCGANATPLLHALGVHVMFQFAIGRPLVRWANCPGRVVASRTCRAASGRLIAITGLSSADLTPAPADDALMVPCYSPDRLIGLKRPKPTNDRPLSCLPHTHTHTHIQEERANGLGGYGPSGRIRLSEHYQGIIKGGSDGEAANGQ